MAGQRIAILICAIVGMVATFLPWASIGLITVAGSKGDGWITFAMLLVPLVLAVRGDRSADFTMPTRLTTLGIGAGVAAFGAWKVFDILGSAEPVEYSGIENSIGAGLYLVIVAGVALIVTPYLIHKK